MTTSIPLHNYDATACIIIMEPLRCGSMSLLIESTSHSQLEGRGACSPDAELANPRRRRDISLDAYCNISIYNIPPLNATVYIISRTLLNFKSFLQSFSLCLPLCRGKPMLCVVGEKLCHCLDIRIRGINAKVVPCPITPRYMRQICVCPRS